MTQANNPSGVVLLNKPRGRTSFSLVSLLRRVCGVKKIGHAGTLDPFASGVMVLLVGKEYTRLSDRFLGQDKEYTATLKLGESTNTYDCEGDIVDTSTLIPTLEEIQKALKGFQGTIEQIPPMFSAKKVQGKKLYELARKGIEIERQPSTVVVSTEILSYEHPYLKLHVSCSKGTYIRSLAHDLGVALGCYAHLSALLRTRSGAFHLNQCTELESISKDALPPFLSIDQLAIDNI